MVVNGCDGSTSVTNVDASPAEDAPTDPPTSTETVTTSTRQVLPDGTTVIRTRDGETITIRPPTSGHSDRAMTSRTMRHPCGPFGRGYFPVAHPMQGLSWPGFLNWSRSDGGGSKLLFGLEEALWLVDNTTGQIDRVFDANPTGSSAELSYGFHANLSPAADRIVYTTCEFPLETTEEGSSQQTSGEPPFPVANYEIVVGDLAKGDSSLIANHERITHNERLDHFPVWSPDGSQIAFMSKSASPGIRWREPDRLHTRRIDGSDKNIRTIVSAEPRGGRGGLALLPPVWSPDGRFLAYYAIDGDRRDRSYILYTIRSEGWDRFEIGRTKSSDMDAYNLPLPSWSPDSEQIAFVAGEGNARQLFTARTDGSDRQLLVSDPQIRQVEWSPDGAEILFVSDWIYFVSPDGTKRRRLESPPSLVAALDPEIVVWSPDGSRIAIHDYHNLLVTMESDGTHNRLLYEGYLGDSRASLPPRSKAVDPAICSEGFVVPMPEANPGLVRDCETLVRGIETLAGHPAFQWRPDPFSGESPFHWRPDLSPIMQWQEVGVSGSPLRVRALNLDHVGLTGSIPPGFGDLQALQRLNLSNNRLSGEIPPELGSLKALEHLDLSGNRLTGEIPAEIGQLAELRILSIHSGEISGPIPVELGELTNLTSLVLSNNSLSGFIPPELAALADLTTLDISDNRLTGCIPGEFSDIWVSGSDLDRCENGG